MYESDRSLVWGTTVYNLQLTAGTHALAYSFPALPLHPGPYSWLVSLFEDTDELDMWEAVPEMLVAPENLEHSSDEWAGVAECSY